MPWRGGRGALGSFPSRVSYSVTALGWPDPLWWVLCVLLQPEPGVGPLSLAAPAQPGGGERC